MNLEDLFDKMQSLEHDLSEMNHQMVEIDNARISYQLGSLTDVIECSSQMEMYAEEFHSRCTNLKNRLEKRK